MDLFRRQDALLLGGLTAALVIVFSSPISRLLDFTRDIERQSGLTLLPALVVLTVVYVFHLFRKRHEAQELAVAMEAKRQGAEQRALELERLVSFGHALARSLDHDSIRQAVAQHLPRVAGTPSVWVLLRQGTQWEALAGDTRGAEDVVDREALAESVVGGQQTPTPADTIGVPLVVGGTALGVLGVRVDDRPLDSDRHRAIEAAAALLAVSLKNAQLFREVRENSLRDGLTGCSNRSHALEVIDGELRRARRSRLPVSMIMFDIDSFKEVNDRYGHLCGDAVLACVGKRMREVLRGSDLKCRYGGEEFLVLLPDTPLAGALHVAETLRREIGDNPVSWTGDSLTVTASFGVAEVVPGEIDMEAIIGRADAALYRAKAEGRNRVCVDTSAPSPVPEFRDTATS